MARTDLDAVGAGLARRLRRNPAGEPIGVLGVELLRSLARGQPVALTDIAAATGLPVEEVTARLGSFPDAEIDPDGKLVGMGLTCDRPSIASRSMVVSSTPGAPSTR